MYQGSKPSGSAVMITHARALAMTEHAGQGSSMREKNGHRLEELGLGRGLEGQPEVLVYHPQARGSHREGTMVIGLWSWLTWVQTPALLLASCAPTGRSTNLSVLQFYI